jgi:hypothetical protein
MKVVLFCLKIQQHGSGGKYCILSQVKKIILFVRAQGLQPRWFVKFERLTKRH